MNIWQWLRRFWPAPVTVNATERLRASFGAFIGIAFTGFLSLFWLGPATTMPLLIAPMGASAVLLFAVPASPLAQPWSIVGGNTISALVGVTCALWIPNPLFASAAAVGISIGAMLAFRCLHPPAGAVALTAVVGGPIIHSLGYQFVLSPVATNSIFLLVAALVFNNITKRKYPHPISVAHTNIHKTTDIAPIDRLGFTPVDVKDVLKEYNQVLDINPDDLEDLFLKTEMHAYRRRFGEVTCEDIMSLDVVTVEANTSLEKAWALLQSHHIKVLPVIDHKHHVIGIISWSDFLENANLENYHSFKNKLDRLMQSISSKLLGQRKTVGQIMSKNVQVAKANVHIFELVPLMSNLVHCIPVVDAKSNQLKGVVTQSDLIAGLYRGKVIERENMMLMAN